MIYPALSHMSSISHIRGKFLLFKDTRPKGFQVVHAEVVPASQRLGSEDVGHHLLVQRVDDRPVKALAMAMVIMDSCIN